MGASQAFTAVETLLTLPQAGKILPHRPHSSTVWRWCRKGVRGIHCEYVRLGGRIFVTLAALEQFGAALAAADGQPAPPKSKPRTAAERTKAVKAACAKLA